MAHTKSYQLQISNLTKESRDILLNYIHSHPMLKESTVYPSTKITKVTKDSYQGNIKQSDKPGGYGGC